MRLHLPCVVNCNEAGREGVGMHSLHASAATNAEHKAAVCLIKPLHS